MSEEKIKPKRPKLEDSGEEMNPFLVDLVLKNLFPYCKESKHNWTNLSDYRTVCKVWDEELVKLIRSDTKIDVKRLLSKYPEGLGWTENGDNFSYDCPYNVAPFENLVVNGTCRNLSDPKLIRWFETMGSSVKRLEFKSSLTCYHHVRFLECVLKVWCKNLKCLCLDSVKCLFSLLHNSKFVDENDIICNLEEVKISVDDPVTGSDVVSLFKCCQSDLLEKYLSTGRTLSSLMPDSSVFRTFGLKIINRLTRNFQESISADNLDFLRKTTGNDGGVLGQVFKAAPVRKLVVSKMSEESYCQDFLTFLNIRQMKLKESLDHFEFDNFLLAKNETHLDAFRVPKFPLKSIKFGVTFPVQIRGALRSFLASFMDTLEELEFSGNFLLQDWETEVDEEFIEISLPRLPKLKRFVNGNIFTNRLGGLEFLKELPLLQTCSLSNTIYHSSIYPLTPSEVFNLLFQACDLEEQHPLQELMLDGKVVYNSYIDEIRNWFPELVKLHLTLDGQDVLVDFFMMARKMKLEDVKVSFYANDNEWCNTGLTYVREMKQLKFLELIYLNDSHFTVSARTCKEGFARAPSLTSLKLTNFGVFAEEVDAIRTSLSHISYVKFSNLVIQHKPIDIQFSVGRDEKIPFNFC